MKSYSIPDLIVGQEYHPRSLARRFTGGVINYATKRNDVSLYGDYEAYAIRWFYNGNEKWATIAVKVGE